MFGCEEEERCVSPVVSITVALASGLEVSVTVRPGVVMVDWV